MKKQINLTPLEIVLFMVAVVSATIIGMGLSNSINPEFASNLLDELITGIIVGIVSGIVIAITLKRAKVD